MQILDVIGESGVATPTQGTSVHDDWLVLYCKLHQKHNIHSCVGERYFLFFFYFFHIDNQGGGYERPSMAWHIWSCYWHICNLKLLLSIIYYLNAGSQVGQWLSCGKWRHPVIKSTAHCLALLSEKWKSRRFLQKMALRAFISHGKRFVSVTRHHNIAARTFYTYSPEPFHPIAGKEPEWMEPLEAVTSVTSGKNSQME